MALVMAAVATPLLSLTKKKADGKQQSTIPTFSRVLEYDIIIFNTLVVFTAIKCVDELALL